VSELPLIDTGGGGFVADKNAAILLGKVFFWDMQVGSDGVQSCGTCHYHGGADHRETNQLSPGPGGSNGIFDETRTGGIGPNYTVKPGDFPFIQFEDPDDRNSTILFETDDVHSSQGVVNGTFTDIVAGDSVDNCAASLFQNFSVGGVSVRKVEPRNAPTTINAALNLRNFWDGRANDIFNGNDPFGLRSDDARILEVQPDGSVVKKKVEFTNASLASQATGPVLSPFEMSCDGRIFQKIGKKLLQLDPLAQQDVHPEDSVLGDISKRPLLGVTGSYENLIMAAFDERLWDSEKLFDAQKDEIDNPSGDPGDSNAYTLMETNFALFWGLSIQLYESTLISDQSPWDLYKDAFVVEESQAVLDAILTPDQQAGLEVFMNEGKCVNCHATAMFTKASTLHLVDEAQEEGLVERMRMGSETHPYTTTGTATLGAQDLRWTLESDASGAPTVLGEATNAAGGDFSLEDHQNDKVCGYITDSFTLDPDGSPLTKDSSFTGFIDSGDPECPQRVQITVVDIGPFKSDNWRGRITGEDISGEDPVDIFRGRVGGYVGVREPALYDNGFYNIGVTPSMVDIGIGGNGPFGNPLSYTQQYVDSLLGKDVADSFQISECNFEIQFNPAVDVFFFAGGFETGVSGGCLQPSLLPTDEQQFLAISQARVAVDGAFKVPTLRNVELTGPYFHNGGYKSLEEVVDFYNRGGNHPSDNLDPDIRFLGLTQENKDNLVAFMKALTDPRVRHEKAPFDRPEIRIPLGHTTTGSGSEIEINAEGSAKDEFRIIAAVGEEGHDGLNAFDVDLEP